MKKSQQRSGGTLRPHKGTVEGQKSCHISGVCCRQSPHARPSDRAAAVHVAGKAGTRMLDGWTLRLSTWKCWEFYFLQPSTKPPVSDRRARVILSVRPGRGQGDVMSLGSGHGGGRPARPT